MDAFKKWVDKDRESHFTIHEEYAAARAWKAAFKIIRKQFNTSGWVAQADDNFGDQSNEPPPSNFREEELAQEKEAQMEDEEEQMREEAPAREEVAQAPIIEARYRR